MKKIALLLLIALTTTASFSQKKKTGGKTETKTTGFAKADNLVAEVKSGNFQLTINENGKPKDAIVIKPADATFAPVDCTIKPFTANNTKLYLLSWTEKSMTKTDLKTENKATIYANIYEPISKKQVFSNYQTTNNITEKVFLDRLKNASETQERIRKEGFEFTLNPDGTVKQKSKNQENNWKYDAIKNEYVDANAKKKK